MICPKVLALSASIVESYACQVLASLNPLIGKEVSLSAANTVNRVYSYMEDLLSLNVSRSSSLCPVPLTLLYYPFPLPMATWQNYLSRYQDHRYASHICNGLTEGFRIGFDYSCKPCPSSRNMKSAMDNELVIESYIADKVELGHLPRSSPFSRFINTSLFAVIPKKGRPNKWRLIVDLSSPKGASDNNGIRSALKIHKH